MFCMFKNSRLTYPLNWIVLLLSLVGVVYWLNFAFIEKAFLERVFGGEALFVDLLLGLPVVLIFALVIYAIIYWGLKVLVMLFLPKMIEQVEVGDTTLSDELEYDQLEEHPSLSDDSESKSSSSQTSKSDSPAKPDER